MRTVVAGSEEMNTTTRLHRGHRAIGRKGGYLRLGNVYHILTTHSPRGKMKRGAHESFGGGSRDTKLPEPYASGTDPVYTAFRNAMALCFASRRNAGQPKKC
jgi:hypothetical protein